MLQIYPQTAPIEMRTDGTAVIAGTRVLLESIIAAFHRGDSPELSVTLKN